MTIKMVAVAEILRRVTDTADCYAVGRGPGEWLHMIASKMADSQTPAIIRAIEDNGFTDPICIEDDYDYNNNRIWRLGNGHHRLAIAILLGLDEIPVDFSSWYSRASTTNQGRISDDRQDGDAELAHWISDMVADRS